MNRIQFFVLTGLSSLVVLLLIGHIFLVRQATYDQNLIAATQQTLTAGQSYETMVRQLGSLIGQEGLKTQDQALKDILTRQQMTYTPPPSTNSTDSPASPGR